MGENEWPEGIKSSLKPDDVIWMMDWSKTRPDGSRLHPDKPEQTEEFESAKALAILLINEVIFLNNHWWEKEWPEAARKITSLNVNCNDIFAWGCADAESADYGDLEEIYRLWLNCPVWGSAMWCLKKRKEMPQKAVEVDMRKAGIYLDAWATEHSIRANFYSGVSMVLAERKYQVYSTWEVANGHTPRPFDKHWWDGWTEYQTAHPDWCSEEWQAADDAARSAWIKENGHDD